MSCPHIPGCAIYPLFRNENLLKVWKINYCEADFKACVRFQRSCSGDEVPQNLLPNGKLLPFPVAPSKG